MKQATIAFLVFVTAFVFFATPVEAAIACEAKGNTAGFRVVGIGKGIFPFLISGCGSLVKDGTGESIACYHSLAGIVHVALSAQKLILGFVGSLALAMFIWGGFQWLIAAGSEKRITAGMTTLKNAVIGLLIVFGAWVVVNVIVFTLNPPQKGRMVVGIFKDATNYWHEIHGEKDPLCYRALTAAELALALASGPVAPPPPSEWAARGACCWSESKLPDASTPLNSKYAFDTLALSTDKATCTSKGNTDTTYIMQEKWFCKDKDESVCGARTPDKGWDGVNSSACEDLWKKPKRFDMVGPLPTPPVTNPPPGTVAPGLPPGSPNIQPQPEIPPP